MAELHAEYVERINRASATGRDGEIADLAAEYDAEATRLITEHQRPTHLHAVSDSYPDEPAKRTGPLRWLTRFDPFGTSQRPAS
jgi:hypothetical protein